MGRVPSVLAWWDGLGAPLRRLPRWAAAGLVLLIVAACIWSVPVTNTYMAADEIQLAVDKLKPSDTDLYRRTVERMKAGEGYYTAALAEQRGLHYPTIPFVTVRQPTLAWLDLWVGLPGMRIAALVLLLANAVAWIVAVGSARARLAEQTVAVVMVAVMGVFAFSHLAGLKHELYAGLLLSLALALYRPHRWWPSLLLLVLALTIREIAAPFALLWALFALDQQRWREVAALAVVLALFAFGIALHAYAVDAHRLPGDLASRGWEGWIGPYLFVGSLVSTTLLTGLPSWLAGPAALLPLLGWAALGGRLGLFASLWFLGHLLMMAVFARLDNFYWILLILPAYGVGLALAPRALIDLARAARGRRPS